MPMKMRESGMTALARSRRYSKRGKKFKCGAKSGLICAMAKQASTAMTSCVQVRKSGASSDLSESTNLFDYLRLEKQFPEKRRTIAGYNLAKIAIALTLVVGLVLIACFRDTCEVIRKKASH